MQKVIAIGALGGSATRVVAQILKDYGIFIGFDLNDAFDNLLFTRLFKNPAWFNKASKDEINFRWQIFEKLKSGQNLSPSKKRNYFMLPIKILFFKSNKAWLR